MRVAVHSGREGQKLVIFDQVSTLPGHYVQDLALRGLTWEPRSGQDLRISPGTRQNFRGINFSEILPRFWRNSQGLGGILDPGPWNGPKGPSLPPASEVRLKTALWVIFLTGYGLGSGPLGRIEQSL